MTDIPRRVFVIWSGPPMNANRLAGLASLRAESGVPVELVRDEDLPRWTVPTHPLPDALRHLSAVHRSDYLRAYLMHHHGGGYSDVKPTSGSWSPAFDALDADPDLVGAGYREVGRHGVADFGLRLRRRWDVQPFLADWWRYRWLQLHHRSLIGNGAFIYRPHTTLTAAWIAEVERRLTVLAPTLARNPAREPKERPDHDYGAGPSRYPVPWSHLLGDVHQPLVRRHRRKVLQVVPTPVWGAYQ